jgi:hypothetical protein
MVDSIQDNNRLRGIAVESRAQSSLASHSITRVTPKADAHNDAQSGNGSKKRSKGPGNEIPPDAKVEIVQDMETGAILCRAVDPVTGAVLKQWPAASAARLRAHVHELEGLLLDTEV